MAARESDTKRGHARTKKHVTVYRTVVEVRVVSNERATGPIMVSAGPTDGVETG